MKHAKLALGPAGLERGRLRLFLYVQGLYVQVEERV